MASHYPKLQIDYHAHAQLADNVWHAQKAGHPRVLTYSGPDLTIRASTRKEAMHFNHRSEVFEIPHDLSRDEYPFACTLEGGKSSWVGHIPPAQNSAQGGLIAAFLKRHNIVAGRGDLSKFEVVVLNHPLGPV
jgi:Deoxyribonuclease NucA/NucB